jgi:hypothetical protein
MHTLIFSALLLSALKSQGIPYTPALVKRTLENTAAPLGTHDAFSIGHGVVQVKTGLNIRIMIYIYMLWDEQAIAKQSDRQRVNFRKISCNDVCQNNSGGAVWRTLERFVLTTIFLPSCLERFQCRYVFMLENRMLKGSTVLKVNFMRLNVSKARKCTVGYN